MSNGKCNSNTQALESNCYNRIAFLVFLSLKTQIHKFWSIPEIQAEFSVFLLHFCVDTRLISTLFRWSTQTIVVVSHFTKKKINKNVRSSSKNHIFFSRAHNHILGLMFHVEKIATNISIGVSVNCIYLQDYHHSFFFSWYTNIINTKRNYSQHNSLGTVSFLEFSRKNRKNSFTLELIIVLQFV